MKNEILELLNKILDSDLPRDVKEKILLHWLLPKAQVEATSFIGPAPIEQSNTRVGAIKRPDKKAIDLKNNPKLKEEEEAMSETLDKSNLNED